MSCLCLGDGKRTEAAPFDDDTAKLLKKPRFQYLLALKPFCFCRMVEKLCKFNGRDSRLCVITESLLVGVTASKADVSFCIRVKDVAELITDSRYLAVGVRICNAPVDRGNGHNLFADMPVDVLLFTPTPHLLQEFVDAFTRAYSRNTGTAVPVRERFPQESYAATLTLLPEGRRVRPKLSAAAVAKLASRPANNISNNSSSSTSSFSSGSNHVREWVTPTTAPLVSRTVSSSASTSDVSTNAATATADCAGRVQLPGATNVGVSSSFFSTFGDAHHSIQRCLSDNGGLQNGAFSSSLGSVSNTETIAHRVLSPRYTTQRRSYHDLESS